VVTTRLNTAIKQLKQNRRPCFKVAVAVACPCNNPAIKASLCGRGDGRGSVIKGSVLVWYASYIIIVNFLNFYAEYLTQKNMFNLARGMAGGLKV